MKSDTNDRRPPPTSSLTKKIPVSRLHQLSTPKHRKNVSGAISFAQFFQNNPNSVISKSPGPAAVAVTQQGGNNKNHFPTTTASSSATKQINDSEENESLISSGAAQETVPIPHRKNPLTEKKSNPRSLWKIPDHFQKPKSSDGEGGQQTNPSQSQQSLSKGGGNVSVKRESFSATRGNAIRDMIKNFGSEATKPSTPQNPSEVTPQPQLQQQQPSQPVSITPARVNDLAVPKYKAVKIMSAASKEITQQQISTVDPAPTLAPHPLESGAKHTEEKKKSGALVAAKTAVGTTSKSSKTRSKFGVVEKLKARCTPVPSQPTAGAHQNGSTKPSEISQLQLIPQESHPNPAGGTGEHANSGSHSSKLLRGNKIYSRQQQQLRGKEGQGKGSTNSALDHKKFGSTGAGGSKFANNSSAVPSEGPRAPGATTAQSWPNGRFLNEGESQGRVLTQDSSSSSSGGAVVTVSSMMSSNDKGKPNFVSFPRQDAKSSSEANRNAALKTFELQGHVIGDSGDRKTATLATDPRPPGGGGTMLSSSVSLRSQRNDSHTNPHSSASFVSPASTGGRVGSEGGSHSGSSHSSSLRINVTSRGQTEGGDESFHGGNHAQLSDHREGSSGVSPGASPPPSRELRGFAAPQSSLCGKSSDQLHENPSSSTHFPSFHASNATTGDRSLFLDKTSSPSPISVQSPLDSQSISASSQQHQAYSHHEFTDPLTLRSQNNVTDSHPAHQTSFTPSPFSLHHPLAPWNQNRPFTSPVFNPAMTSAAAAGAMAPPQSMKHSTTTSALLPRTPAAATASLLSDESQQQAESDLGDLDEKQSAAAIQLRNARRRFRQSSQIALTRKWPGGIRGSPLVKLPDEVSPRVKAPHSAHDQRDDSPPPSSSAPSSSPTLRKGKKEFTQPRQLQQQEEEQHRLENAAAASDVPLRSCLKKSRQKTMSVAGCSIVRRVKFNSNVTVEYFEAMAPLEEPSLSSSEGEGPYSLSSERIYYRPTVPKVKIQFSSSSSRDASPPRNVEEALEQSRKERERLRQEDQGANSPDDDDASDESNTPIMNFAKERFTVNDLMAYSSSH